MEGPKTAYLPHSERFISTKIIFSYHLFLPPYASCASNGHKLTHEAKKPHACHFCDKSYSDARSLRRHYENTHSEEYDRWLAVSQAAVNGDPGALAAAAAAIIASSTPEQSGIKSTPSDTRKSVGSSGSLLSGKQTLCDHSRLFGIKI
ncbi:unnamed protein product [Protopolystoma xenopodis]|uniref:C2H2-type domain-containing protein n=1 Tax=Protopolystoma xenopodis TaxID=117903 RepID=A0A448XG85_9PLAT|nr:unnamed protein product [Protopolystoma xenopodis]